MFNRRNHETPADAPSLDADDSLRSEAEIDADLRDGLGTDDIQASDAPAEETVPDDAFVHDESNPPPAPAPAGLNQRGKVRPTRVSGLWIALVTAAVLAIFLLIFISQNSAKVTIQFLGWDGQISLAVALLFSAVIGILVVAVPGTLRIVQLRRALRKNAHR